MYAARVVHKNPQPELHLRPSYKVPYILPSSVCPNSFVFTLFAKLPGCVFLFPNRNLLRTPLFCPLPPLCFQSLPTIKFCNSFLLTTMQIARGVGTPEGAGVKVILELRCQHIAPLTEMTWRSRLAGKIGAGRPHPAYVRRPACLQWQ